MYGTDVVMQTNARLNFELSSGPMAFQHANINVRVHGHN